MKPLIYPKKERTTGIYAYCQKCKTCIGSGKCQRTKKRIQSCEFPEFHTFRASLVVPNTGGTKRKNKILNTTDVREAMVLKYQFEQEIKGTHFEIPRITPIDSKKGTPSLLIECMDTYVAFLNNTGVEAHKRKERTRHHLMEVERFFKYFCLCLKEKGINHTVYRLDQVNDTVVGWFHTYLIENLGYKNTTYNKAMGVLRQFVTWCIDEHGCSIKNPFLGVAKRKTVMHNGIISQEEFKALCDAVVPEKSIKTFSTGERKNYYRPWLVSAFILAIETGLRREEFMSLRFCDIRENEEHIPTFIQVENYKVNRAKGNGETKEIKSIPVTIALHQLLKSLEYQKWRCSDRFLIAPLDTASRTTLMNLVSKAFTHFWESTGIDKDMQLKYLRKTYLTALVSHFGDKANIISNHSGIEVMKKHYINHESIIKGVNGFSVF
jgi:integrase